MSHRINRMGDRYGRLLVVESAPSTDGRGARWRCQCDCGATHVAYSYNLASGSTRSCGCLRRELAPETGRMAARKRRAA